MCGAGRCKTTCTAGSFFCFVFLKKCMYVNVCIETDFKRITTKLSVIISGWQEYWWFSLFSKYSAIKMYYFCNKLLKNISFYLNSAWKSSLNKWPWGTFFEEVLAARNGGILGETVLPNVTGKEGHKPASRLHWPWNQQPRHSPCFQQLPLWWALEWETDVDWK